MMKATLRILTVLAFANLLALAGFVGWLGFSGRIDRGRLVELRELFRNTVEADRLAEAARAADEIEAAGLAAEEMRLRELPMARTDQIAASARFEDRAALALRALEEEQRRLQADLDARAADLASREAQFADRQREWERSIAEGMDRQTNEQFRKTVRLLEAAPPKQAREWVLELLSTDRADLAVAYLDAMNPAKSAALMKAFKLQGDSKVATQLLDRLRTLGLETEAGRLRTDAADTAQPQAEPAASSGGRGGGPTSNGAVALPGGPSRGTRVDVGSADRR